MKINFTLDYNTNCSERILLKGTLIHEDKVIKIEQYLDCNSNGLCSASIEIPDNSVLKYHYYLKNEIDGVERREKGCGKTVDIKGNDIDVRDLWQDFCYESPLNSCAFADSVLKQNSEQVNNGVSQTSTNKEVTIKTFIPYLLPSQNLFVCGNIPEFGNWDTEKAMLMLQADGNNRYVTINLENNKHVEYKFVIKSASNTEWESGDNRVLDIDSSSNSLVIQNSLPNFENLKRKFAGVSVPVFSLRTKKDYGVGEFTDLINLVDFCKEIGMSFIQVLPINDTTITHTWIDSYPYKANSTFALHPIYINLEKAGKLKSRNKMKQYRAEGDSLNSLEKVDYEAVFNLKWKYLHDLFDEKGEQTINSDDFKQFFLKNSHWLTDYAVFSYLRDSNKTAEYEWWKDLSDYNKDEVNRLADIHSPYYKDICFYYFVQFHLYNQLSEVHEYAREKGVAIKGDVPIGICSQSADVWSNPTLFNKSSKAGAPPDMFSIKGQNWGFPTYNWNEMSKDNYQWWKDKFTNMANFFDAYRIDHILGFFRIWEIPSKNILGIGGHFSPALPYNEKEIESYGFYNDLEYLCKPHIHYDDLYKIFGENISFIISTFFEDKGYGMFEFNELYDTEAEIENYFVGQNNDENRHICDSLLMLSNDHLFVKDPYETGKYHPRINAFDTYAFNRLSYQDKETYTNLYNDFFYKRHNSFWAEMAMRKLPVLIDSTNMLVCGEDLGMIPDCVPSVMKNLDILSLEIERMPKENGVEFGNPLNYNYNSVCTTSTHDMSTIRGWWKEDREKIQRYFNNVLNKEGDAPADCDESLCRDILNRHLLSPAILAIFPIQDWLSVRQDLCSKNPEDERINVPSNPENYWQYRMSISIESLDGDMNLKNELRKMISDSDRTV